MDTTPAPAPEQKTPAQLVDELLVILCSIRDGQTTIETFVDEYDPLKRTFISNQEYAAGLAIAGLQDGPSVSWPLVRRLEAEGFVVRKLEGDSFGWLVGGIKIVLAADNKPVWLSFG